jgi:hypothetical protein
MAARLRYRLVDVFTDRPLAGNPLCVVLDPRPPELMQGVAREANLSETTFPVQTGENAYRKPTRSSRFARSTSRPCTRACSLLPWAWAKTRDQVRRRVRSHSLPAKCGALRPT